MAEILRYALLSGNVLRFPDETLKLTSSSVFQFVFPDETYESQL